MIGRMISGRYEVTKRLGAGGMGAVYLAVHRQMADREIVLKIIHPQYLGNASEEEAKTAKERFLREAVVATKIVHPNAVPVRDFGIEDDGLMYMTMDLARGETLESAIESGAAQAVAPDGVIPLARALDILQQILQGVAAAHDESIIHRDLKPGNIMVEPHGETDRVKVLDFGIAKLAADVARDLGVDSTRRTQGAIGTPAYMPPEQIQNEAIDGRADLYAVGMIFFEMLTGKLAFESETTMQLLTKALVEPVPPVRQRNPALQLPGEVDQIIQKATQKKPEDRFDDARQFLKAIADLKESYDPASTLDAAQSPLDAGETLVMGPGSGEKDTGTGEVKAGKATDSDTPGTKPTLSIDAAGAAGASQEGKSEAEAAATGTNKIALLVGGVLLLALVIAAAVWASGSARYNETVANGRKALEAKQYPEAIQHFDEALKMRPNDEEVKALRLRAQRGNVLAEVIQKLDDRDWAGARAHLRGPLLSEADPTLTRSAWFRLHVGRAEDFKQARDADRVEDALREAIKHGELTAEHKILRGWAASEKTLRTAEAKIRQDKLADARSLLDGLDRSAALDEAQKKRRRELFDRISQTPVAVTIRSRPRGLVVRLGDVVKGRTPLRTRLLGGPHDVRLTDEVGFSRTFTVKVGESGGDLEILDFAAETKDERAAFQAVDMAPTEQDKLRACQKYLDRFPQGDLVAKVQEVLEGVSAAQVVRAETVAWRMVKEAEAEAKKQRRKISAQVEALRTYLKYHPNGSHAQQASGDLIRIDGDLASDALNAPNSRSGLTNARLYLSLFPQGNSQDAVKRRIPKYELRAAVESLHQKVASPATTTAQKVRAIARFLQKWRGRPEARADAHAAAAKLLPLARVMKLGPHQGNVVATAFSPDGKRLVSSSVESGQTRGDVNLWKVVTGEKLGVLSSRGTSAQGALAFSLDGKSVLVGRADGTVDRIDLKGVTLATKPAHSGPVRALAIGLGDVVFSAAQDAGTVKAWNADLTPRGAIETGAAAVTSLAVDLRRSTLAVATRSGRVLRYDLKTLQPVGEGLQLDAPADDLTFGPNGTLVASSSTAGVVYVYAGWAKDGNDTAQPRRIKYASRSVSISPDGTYLVLGGLLWRLDGGKNRPWRRLPSASPVRFGPSGRYVAVRGKTEERWVLLYYLPGVVGKKLSK